MVGDGTSRLRELVIGLVRRFLVRVHRLGLDGGRLMRVLAQVRRVLGVLRHELGNDIARTRKRRLRRGKAALGVDVFGRRHERLGPLGGLHENEVGERFETGVARLGRTGSALLAVGLVEVLHALKRGRLFDARAQLLGEFALGVDRRDHVGLALLEIAKVRQAIIERAQRDVVHAARGFLAVARDERDRRPLIDERDHGLDASGGLVQLGGEGRDDALMTGRQLLGRSLRAAAGRRGIRDIVGGERAGGAEGAHRGGTGRRGGRRGFRNGRWRWRSGLDDDILARTAPLRAQRGDHIHDGGDVDVVRFGHVKTLPSNSARHYILPDRWDTSCNPYAAAQRRSRTAGPSSPECVPSRSRRPEANHWGPSPRDWRQNRHTRKPCCRARHRAVPPSRALVSCAVKSSIERPLATCIAFSSSAMGTSAVPPWPNSSLRSSCGGPGSRASS